MTRPPLPANDIIAAAIYAYAKNNTQANLVKLLQAIAVQVSKNADIIIPIADDAPEGQLALRTHTTEDDQVFVAGYSSQEALDLYEKGINAVARPLINYLEVICKMDGIEGILLNPESPAPITIKKQMIAGLLNEIKKANE